MRGSKACAICVEAQKSVLGAGVPEPEQLIDDGGSRRSRARETRARWSRRGAWRAARRRRRRAATCGHSAAPADPAPRSMQELARRIGQMILAAQHVRDPHARIVHGIAEEERRGAVGAPHDEVADVVAQEALRAVHEIDEFDALAQRHAETQRRSAGPALAAARAPRGSARGRCRRSAAAFRPRAGCAAKPRAPAPSRSTDRRRARARAARNQRHRWRRARTGGTGRAHPRGPAPHPSRGRASAGPR